MSRQGSARRRAAAPGQPAVLPATLLVSLLLLRAAPAGADSTAPPILHEYVPPAGEEATAAARAAGGADLPARIRHGEETLPRPQVGSTTEAAASGAGRAAADIASRARQIRLDRDTTHEGTLRYAAVFNPTVVPFKRLSALDEVGAGYVLRVRDTTPRLLAVAGGLTPPDREPFWATLTLEVKSGQLAPIPSVAAEARILSYAAGAGIALTFYQDSAANLWVRATRSGRVRLVLLTDAPRSYFSARVPPHITAAMVPHQLRPVLPTSVRQAAERVIGHLRLARGETIATQLETLVSYFRSFEEGALPRLTGDAYLDVALSRLGVCRHRSFAFVVTAQALGIPARYVQNEAHAFVEVFVPRMGWTRIDLGGAAAGLDIQATAGTRLHDPVPDPFPRPHRFGQSYSLLGPAASGLPAVGRQGARRQGGEATPLRVLARSGQRTGDASIDPARRRQDGQRSSATAPEVGSGAGPVAGSGAPGAVEPERAAMTEGGRQLSLPGARLRTRTLLDSAERTVFRGEPLRVTGRILTAGRGAAGLLVEIYLSRDGRTGYRVGATLSGPDGRFAASLPVPRDVPVGDYRLFAETTGDHLHEGSTSP